ncbi:hypothetical protein XaC1_416 [Xanthomonas phage XaC1]|nr:hypothetical protein XaC1_416 [Xanthomonas phage XaC1]
MKYYYVITYPGCSKREFTRTIVPVIKEHSEGFNREVITPVNVTQYTGFEYPYMQYKFSPHEDEVRMTLFSTTSEFNYNLVKSELIMMLMNEVQISEVHMHEDHVERLEFLEYKMKYITESVLQRKSKTTGTGYHWCRNGRDCEASYKRDVERHMQTLKSDYNKLKGILNV